MRILHREPALWTGFLNALFTLIVTLNVGLTPQEAGALTVLITAVFTAIATALTRPIAPAAFTGLVTAGADVLAAFHFHLSGATVGAVNAVAITGLMLITRAQVTPSRQGAS